MNVMVRHDAELKITTRCDMVGHKQPCSNIIVPAPHLDAHMAVEAYKHGKISGRDSGVRVRCTYKLVNPERDVLKEGQFCTCADCLAGKHSL